MTLIPRPDFKRKPPGAKDVAPAQAAPARNEQAKASAGAAAASPPETASKPELDSKPAATPPAPANAGAGSSSASEGKQDSPASEGTTEGEATRPDPATAPAAPARIEPQRRTGGAVSSRPEAPGASGASASVDLRQRLHRTLIAEIDQAALSLLPPDEARNFVEGAVRQLIDREVPAGRAGFRDRLLQQLVDDVLGLGPIEPLLRDQSISEIMVNGARQVYIERAGKLHLADVRFQDDQHVVHVIERILASSGRHIDESSPLADAKLPDGSRVNAVIAPATISGPLLTIRKFIADRLSVDDLISLGSLTSEARDLLAASVHAGLNIIVSGGTGSGKTTMLNVLSSWIPSDERIVTIEDPAELSLRQPHVVRLEARPDDRGDLKILQRDLLQNALRMRPDRIIVGEVRGPEAFDMLQAMNTGHDGSLSTVHANTPRDAIRRIENMVMMAGFELPIRAIREQIASAIDLVLQVERMRDGTRRSVAISEVVGMEDQTVTMQDLFLFEHEGLDEEDHIIGSLRSTGLRPSFSDRIEALGARIPVPGEEESLQWVS